MFLPYSKKEASGRRSSISSATCSVVSAAVTDSVCIVAALSAWAPEPGQQ